MGNLLPVYQRPLIPIQPAETVFSDKKGNLIPHVYGGLYDAEYQEIIISKLTGFV